MVLNQDFTMNDTGYVTRGLFGVTSVFGGVGISLTDIEQWMRIGSLAIGMAVGLATLRSILRSRTNSKAQRKDE